jgi:hypothetical protein
VEDLQDGKPDVGLEPPQQRCPRARGGRPVLPVVEAAVGDEQPILPAPVRADGPAPARRQP